MFGQVQPEVAGPGLAVTWPFPIGEIRVVNVKLRDLDITDFWMNETPEDKTKSLSARMPSGDTLRPGWDGALFTGDRNLIHVRFVCSLVVDNPIDYDLTIPDAEDPQAARGFGRTKDPVTQEEVLVEPVRSAVCNAAINIAGSMTADSIQNGQGLFIERVRMKAQEELNRIKCGLKITNLAIPTEGITWPLAARNMYQAAQAAASRKEGRIKSALAEADSLLVNTAGQKYRVLVRDPSQMEGRQATTAPASGPAEEVDLIGQYEAARAGGNEGQASAVMARIDDFLTGSSITGEAKTLVSKAMSDQVYIKQTMEARAATYASMKDQYLSNPEFVLDKLWLEARGDILSQPSVLVYYLDASDGKTTIKINHDPDILRQLQEQLIKERDKRIETGKAATPTPAPSLAGGPSGPGGRP